MRTAAARLHLAARLAAQRAARRGGSRAAVVRPALVLHTMRGFGDSIYQRLLVRELARKYELYVRTPWPELFEDLPVHFVQDPTALRTQAANVRRQIPARWTLPPKGARVVEVRYHRKLARSNILAVMCQSLGMQLPLVRLDLPPTTVLCSVTADKPLAVLRPVTVRQEWHNSARNPRPEYLVEAAALLRARFHVVSVADVAPPQEWLEGEPPVADTTLHRGELGPRELLALLRAAAVVVGGVGWIAPVSVAAGVPLVLVGGGLGGYNAPERIFHPQLPTGRVRWLLPDQYCGCTDMRHDCEKTITDFGGRFRAALAELT